MNNCFSQRRNRLGADVLVAVVNEFHGVLEFFGREFTGRGERFGNIVLDDLLDQLTVIHHRRKR